MKRTTCALALVCVFTGGLAAGDTPPRWSDQEVRKFAYAAGPRWPAGFGAAPLFASGLPIYCHRPHWITEDAAEARRWIDAHLPRSSIPDDAKVIRETKVHAKGIDFRAGKMWFRVHRPSWFAWAKHWVAIDSMLDAAGTPRLLGTLPARPITKGAMRDLAEYDWRIRWWNGSGVRVLASESRQTPTHLLHVLETIELTRGDWNLPDTIRRWRWTYAVDRKTGRTTKSRVLVRAIDGRANRMPAGGDGKPG